MNKVSASASTELPEANLVGKRSLEETLAARRSIREYTEAPLADSDISQLLWAAQGITDPSGLRTAPSAGALYPLELYVAQSSGLYHYEPSRHHLTRTVNHDIRRAIYDAALAQEALLEAPAVFVITAVYARTRGKYQARAERYVQMEAGHAAQNLLLQATALQLGGVPVGAFDDQQLSIALRLSPSETPLYLIPVGHPR